MPVRVRSSLYCRSDLTAPWGFAVEARPSATFHLLLEGEAWLEVPDGEPPRRLRAGDLVILPRGHAHQLRDRPGSRAPLLKDLLKRHRVSKGVLHYGGGGSRTEILCGGFTLESPGPVPLLQVLPAVLHIRATEPANADWLPVVIDLLRRQTRSDAPGTDAVIARLSDLLVTQTLRQGLIDIDRTGLGTPQGLQDRNIATALRLIREDPGHDWTVSELASTVAMSRSAFAVRFRSLVGRSPMRFLADYRLARAADFLRSTPATLFEIAHDTGYESEASLSRAFRRAFGVAPGAYRKKEEPNHGSPSTAKAAAKPVRLSRGDDAGRLSVRDELAGRRGQVGRL